MNEKLNVAEILKDCPKGMELDCTICNGVKFIELDRNHNFPIVVRANNGYEFTLTKYGQVHNIDDAKCVIFPKGKTTWEGFIPPCKFKDGDIVFYNDTIAIFKEWGDETLFKTYVTKYLCCDSLIDKNVPLFGKNIRKEVRFATNEEKQKLFQAIKDNGYSWNTETKTLEKLIKPKFKVGDRIKSKYNDYLYDVKELTDTHYILVEVEDKLQYTEPIIEDKNWKLVPNKFDITTLKPFDKVLTRANDDDTWVCNLYSHRIKDYYVVLNAELAPQCIPYEGNEHLLGTTNDCNEFYKTW